MRFVFSETIDIKDVTFIELYSNSAVMYAVARTTSGPFEGDWQYRGVSFVGCVSKYK